MRHVWDMINVWNLMQDIQVINLGPGLNATKRCVVDWKGTGKNRLLEMRNWIEVFGRFLQFEGSGVVKKSVLRG